MSGDLLHRSFGFELEVRADGRTLAGVAVPFHETVALPNGERERFLPGSFTRTIHERGDRIKLLANHDWQSNPIGKVTSLIEDARVGLLIEARVSKTSAGDEALALIRDGAIDSFSVGFFRVRTGTGTDGAVEVQEAKLYEVSAVAFPAYESARIAAVRSERPLGAVDAYRRLCRPEISGEGLALDLAYQRLGL